jgi:hypothetical protein
MVTGRIISAFSPTHIAVPQLVDTEVGFGHQQFGAP